MKNLPLLPLLFSSLLAIQSLASAELPNAITTLRFINGGTLKLVRCCHLDISRPLLTHNAPTENVNSEKCPAVAYLKLMNTHNGNIAVTKCSHVAEYLKEIERNESK